MRAHHPDSALASVVWFIAIFLVSAACFALYLYPASLHDTAHYMTAGVTQLRDHKDLPYLYTPGFLGGPSYEYFQDGQVNFDMRTSYPSKLYSSLFGLAWEITGKLRFSHAQWISFLGAFASNVLLYLIGSRFLSRTILIAFMLSVMFLPLSRSGFSPGNDVLGYFSCLLLLWMSLCLRINPFLVGLVGGILFHFRSQSLAILFALPLLTACLFRRKLLRESLVPLVAGAALTYVAVSAMFSAAVQSVSASNPIAFYVDFYLRSFYRPTEWPMAAHKFVDNVTALFRTDHLFIFAYTSILCLFPKRLALARMLSVGAWIYIAVPLVIYSLDRNSQPHARYYLAAIPLLALAWFTVVQQLGRAGFMHARAALTATVAVVWLGWYSVHGFPAIGPNTPQSITARLKFPEFARVERVLRENFGPEDFLVANHALFAGWSQVQNIIYAPGLASFKSGDNSEISGIAFLYSEQAPNDFFRPGDWLVNGVLPDEISDNSGVIFKKIYSEVSQLPTMAGDIQAEAIVVIYKNMGVTPGPAYDADGRRVRRNSVANQLPRQRLGAPDFSDPIPWGPRFEKARNPQGSGVVVGPGPNSENILYQIFPAGSGERFRIVAKTASVGKPAALARLQVNWLDARSGVISSDITVIRVTPELKVYSAMVVSPPGTVAGMIYVSPHRGEDTLQFTEMSVMSK